MSIRTAQRGRDRPHGQDREDESEGSHHVGSLFGEDFGVGSEKGVYVEPGFPVGWEDADGERASGPVLAG
jgi:hypothetical protein